MKRKFSRPPRRVRRTMGGDESVPLEAHPRLDTEAALTAAPAPAKKRKIWKRLLIIFLILLGLGLAMAVAGYFYVKTAHITGERQGRINIMVMGVDSAARLSDTLMIVSIDTRSTKEPKLAMISLPRDLYVNIPGVGGSKINAAYSYGENSGYKGGGRALAERTVEENFGLPVHYFALLNFNGFKDLVDAVGGVDIKIKEDLYDPEYPKVDYSGVEPFSLKAGQHHLDGDLALKVTRCRKGTCGNDYGRAARQQQVILALKAKIFQPGNIWRWGRLNNLKNAVEDNVRTNLSLRQLAKLYLIFRNVEDRDSTRHVLDTSNFLVPVGGGSDLVPRVGDFSEINVFMKNIFEHRGNTLPETER